MSQIVLFNFNTSSDLDSWRIVNDGVMGGWSKGNLSITTEGHCRFTGEVRLENNGGFTSMRSRMNPISTSNKTKVIIRLKGDEKRYQFRIKSNKRHRHSYVYNFQTSGSWQTVEIPLGKMTPTFRGMRLNMPNFEALFIEEIAILISNKREESFELDIDKIELH